ncbi:hypothetical protein CKA32_001056 [Geitlerinema sp. FC II]|nr:hypothetical protein CKA32_001056 [Geitlerinema sp. FC II]
MEIQQIDRKSMGWGRTQTYICCDRQLKASARRTDSSEIDKKTRLVKETQQSSQ